MTFEVLGESKVPLVQLKLQGERKTLADVKLQSYDEEYKHDRTLLKKAGLMDQASHCVSVLGATHAGKSFVLNKLIGKDVLRVADDGAILPTTAGAQSVLLQTDLPSLPLLRLVDYEGADGADTKPCELEEDSTWNAREGESRRDLWKLRREATGTLLPRLAYLTTDVLVYITDADPSRATTLDECASLIARAANNAEREAPSLIIIFNKMAPKAFDSRTDNQFSEEMNEAHDFDGLAPQTFYKVRLMRLPQLTEAAEDIRRFNEAMAKVSTAMFELLKGREELRIKTGTIFNACVWRPIFTIVCDNMAVDNYMFMSECIMRAMYSEEGNTWKQNSLRVFTYAISTRPIMGDSKIFRSHFMMVARQLALMFVLRDREAARNIGTTLGEIQRADIADNFGKVLKEVAGALVKYFAPCGASHDGARVKDVGKGIMIECTKRRGDHGDAHKNHFHSSSLTDLDQGILGRIMSWAKRRKNTELFRPTWKGVWVPPKKFETTIREDIAIAVEFLNVLLALTKWEDKYLYAAAWLNVHRGFRRSVPQGMTLESGNLGVTASNVAPPCGICIQSTLPNPLPCGHMICNDCFAHLKLLESGDLEEAIRVLKWDQLETVEMNHRSCPFC